MNLERLNLIKNTKKLKLKSIIDKSLKVNLIIQNIN